MIERRVALMEFLDLEMKHRGLFCAQKLSLKTVTGDVKTENALQVTFKLHEVPFYTSDSTLVLIRAESNNRVSVWNESWAVHQRHFKHLFTSSKSKEAVKLSKKAIDGGKCVVICLQTTEEILNLSITLRTIHCFLPRKGFQKALLANFFLLLKQVTIDNFF